MATRVSPIPPFPPVRPMDPVYLSKFVTKRPLDKKTVKGFISALNAFNKKCNRAAIEFEAALNKLLKP